jgi:glutaryl-CoA dehydrogenase
MDDTARQYTLDRKQFDAHWPPTSWCRKSWPTCRRKSPSAFRARLRLGRMKDDGSATPEIVSMMKRNSCGKALDIARTARDMLGGNGISDDFGVIRHVVNLEVGQYLRRHARYARPDPRAGPKPGFRLSRF